jgi:hypothetical protein
VVYDHCIHDLELAVKRQLLDEKAPKMTRPRRTDDYVGGMGRRALVCQCLNLHYRNFVQTGSFSCMEFRKLQTGSRYVLYIRPSLPYIIDVRTTAHEHTRTC